MYVLLIQGSQLALKQEGFGLDVDLGFVTVWKLRWQIDLQGAFMWIKLKRILVRLAIFIFVISKFT